MKNLTSCSLVLVLALVAVPAVQAAEQAVAAPAAQPAVVTAPAAQTAVDAPVVEMLAPSQQPVFANLRAPVPAAGFCIDSGIHCGSTAECADPSICGPRLNCVCRFNGIENTCQYCP